MENINEGSPDRFFKEIEYNREPHLRDFIFGHKVENPHGHITTSGALTLDIVNSLSGAVCQNEVIGSIGVTTLSRIVDSKKAGIWYLRDEKTNDIILSGIPVLRILPNNS